MSKLSVIQSLVLPVLILSACGGSGGSKSPNKAAGETPTSSTASSIVSASLVSSSRIASSATLSSATLSSTPLSSLASSSTASSVALASSLASSSTASSVVLASSLVSSAGNTSSSLAASSATGNLVVEKVSGLVDLKQVNGLPIENDEGQQVTVTVSLLNSADQLVTSKTFNALAPAMPETNPIPFSLELSGVDAKFLVVHIAEDGYTDYARRFDVAPELNIRASLSQLPAQEILASTAVTISGETVDGFNFSVSDKNDPVEAGSEAGLADLTVAIPKSALPAGTTSIDVKMQAFNPNKLEDAEYFPGAYADSDGNKLLSVAFNYADVTTNTGVSLKKMAAAAKNQPVGSQKPGFNKTAAEPIVINRKIPVESCSALKQMGDSSATLPGFQVPVYTYNPDSGLWDLLGQGDLYNDNRELISSTFKDFDCTASNYILEVKVTNEIFASSWWNLDYPLVFTQPVKMCADIQLVDESSLPISNTALYLHDDDDVRSYSAETYVTDANGKLHIEAFALDPVAVDTSAELVIYSKNYLSTIRKIITLSPACSGATPVVIKTPLPAICKAEGAVKDKAGKPLLNSVVFAGSYKGEDLPVMPSWSVTDSEGKYSIDVSCGRDYGIVEYFSWLMGGANRLQLLDDFTFAVNGNINGSEVSDNGKTASLQNIVADRSKPIAYIFNDYDASNKFSLEFLYAGSAYPLSYSFEVVDLKTNQVYEKFSGTLSK
ncbi:MAG TPA: hypothetical protein VN030_05240, partial [Cellvibrio sp.]|nr:hypothetical protein [Cellvibrio sp.]